MEFKQLFALIKRRVLFLVCIPILVSIITVIINISFIDSVYEASATLYVMNQKILTEEQVSYEEILANQNLTKDYRELIKSKLILNTVIQELGLKEISSSELSRKVTVVAKNETRILEIKVKDKDPLIAKNITNKICQVFKRKSKNLMKINNIEVIDVAELPISQIKPKTLLNTILSLLISILATLFFFYIFELINETIKTSEDIETYLGLNVLGTIPSFKVK